MGMRSHAFVSPGSATAGACWRQEVVILVSEAARLAAHFMFIRQALDMQLDPGTHMGSTHVVNYRE